MNFITSDSDKAMKIMVEILSQYMERNSFLLVFVVFMVKFLSIEFYVRYVDLLN